MSSANMLAVQRALDKAADSLGVQPINAPSVVQYLEEEGIALVPVTIIGASGWTPSELWAFQAGVMHERYEKRA